SSDRLGGEPELRPDRLLHEFLALRALQVARLCGRLRFRHGRPDDALHVRLDLFLYLVVGHALFPQVFGKALARLFDRSVLFLLSFSRALSTGFAGLGILSGSAGTLLGHRGLLLETLREYL